jgi:hypothetical protein
VPQRTNHQNFNTATTTTTTDREETAAAEWDRKHQPMLNDSERANARARAISLDSSTLVVHGTGTTIVTKSPSNDGVPPNRPYLYLQQRGFSVSEGLYWREN